MDKKLNLEEKINKIEKTIDISNIVNNETNSIENIKKYYSVNHLAYKFFHSKMGFMHFRVSKNAELRDDDIFYQPNTISNYIKKNATVVELGPGQGANIVYLAKKHPDSSFIGVDLKPPKIKKDYPKNIKYYKHDYSDLSFIETSSIDVVFGIETIVHCSDKKKVFNEVARILKKDGILIVYDYSLVHELNEYMPYEQTAIKIISRGGVSALIESNKTWKSYFKKCGFKEVSSENLNKYVKKDLKNLERKANHIMKKDLRIKLIFGIFPSLFVNNILIGWIGYDSCASNIGQYNEWIYKKI